MGSLDKEELSNPIKEFSDKELKLFYERFPGNEIVTLSSAEQGDLGYFSTEYLKSMSKEKQKLFLCQSMRHLTWMEENPDYWT